MLVIRFAGAAESTVAFLITSISMSGSRKEKRENIKWRLDIRHKQDFFLTVNHLLKVTNMVQNDKYKNEDLCTLSNNI